jgi:hypothetical protein
MAEPKTTDKEETTVSKVEYDAVVAQNKELQKRFNNAVDLLNTLLDKFLTK